MNNNIIPDKSDVTVFPNGAVYVRCHFVSVGLDKYSKEHLEAKAKEAKAINTHVMNNIFNAMFVYQADAEKYGNSL